MTPIEKYRIAKALRFATGVCLGAAFACFIGMFQHQDEKEAEIAVSQVMACSTVVAACERAGDRK